MSGYARGSRGTYRSTLNAMVAALAPATETTFPIPRSDPTPPYTPAETTALLSWANAQTSPSRRGDARVILALGFGAGLATRELLAVRVEDVFVTDDQVQVMVWNDRPRLVPVLSEWDVPLRAVSDTSPQHALVFRPGRTTIRAAQVTDFLHRGHRTALDVRPSRMRTTWMLGHLRAGTPPADLLRIAGLENLAALDRITRFLPPPAAMPPVM